MKTDELIDELGRDLKPIRRLPPPWRRAAAWFACGVAYVAAVGTFAWIRRGTLGVEATGPYVLQQGALALVGLLAALGAFASVVPGTTSRVRTAAVMPVGVMMVALLWGTARDLQQFGTAGFGRETDWPCVVSIALGGLVLWGVASAMLRRGAVLEPRVTSVLAALAAVSLANVEACISRVHGFTATVIVWHGLTAALVMSVLVVLGPRVFPKRLRTLEVGRR
jgi:hypothetical protein